MLEPFCAHWEITRNLPRQVKTVKEVGQWGSRTGAGREGRADLVSEGGRWGSSGSCQILIPFLDSIQGCGST